MTTPFFNKEYVKVMNQSTSGTRRAAAQGNRAMPCVCIPPGILRWSLGVAF